jgi:hypothetical protein
MKKIILSFTVITLLVSACVGGFAAFQYVKQGNRWHKTLLGSKPTPDEILAKYYQVTGENSQQEQTSLRMKATLTPEPAALNFNDLGATLSGQKLDTQISPMEMDVTAKFPDKFRIEIKGTVTVSGYRKFGGGKVSATHNLHAIQAFDGEQGWSKELTPESGYRVTALDTAKINELKSDLSLKYMNLFSRYTSVRLIGEQRAEGGEKGTSKEFYVLQGVSTQGNLEKLYFNIETGLLECTEVEPVVTSSPGVQKTFFSDYRDIQGVKLPFRVRLVSSKFNATMETGLIELNPPVDDSIFAKP